MREELAERRRRLTDQLADLKCDSILISALPNIRYLSGFTGSNAALLLTGGSALLFTDPRYTIQAGAESDCRVRIVGGPLFPEVAKVIARLKLRRTGFERGRLVHGSYLEWVAGLPLGSRAVPLGPLTEQLRTVKSEGEQALIRESVQLNSRAFERTVSKLKASATENDIAAELEYQMRRLGAEKPAFETIVATGPRSALPHAQPSGQRLFQDRLLLIDMGAVLAGYCSDMTRMLHLGKPAPKARQLYKAVLEAQLAALDRLREGVTANAVDSAARKILRAHGFDKQFVHSTGHGLGLEIHETPRIGKRDKSRLKAGMVITIEPGAYVEGFGGVRIEDTVLVTTNGYEVLTRTPKDLVTF